jgi:fatty acid desaturase
MGFWNTLAYITCIPLIALGVFASIGYGWLLAGTNGGMSVFLLYVGSLVTGFYLLHPNRKQRLFDDSKLTSEQQQEATDRYIEDVKSRRKH